MAIAAVVLSFFIQLFLPLLILGVSRIPAPEQSFTVLYAVKPPAETRVQEGWTGRLLSLVQRDKDVQKGRLDVFPTRESAQAFCERFGEVVRNEGWRLERCDVFPLQGVDPKI